MNTALIIVDVQNDFLPGGALAVPDGDKILDGIFKLINPESPDKYYDLVVASYDWHPSNHCSFVENGGEWPAHCVQNTYGALINPTIFEMGDHDVSFVAKGGNPEREAYSAFDGFVLNTNGAILGGYLLDNFIQRVEIVGLALDYCVRATALDAVEHGFHTEVLLDLTRPVTWETGAKAISDLQDEDVSLSYYQ